jgi:hypothetical protein
MQAARFQLSAFSAQQLNKCSDFDHFMKQNFFAKRKEVIDKESPQGKTNYASQRNNKRCRVQSGSTGKEDGPTPQVILNGSPIGIRI